jgi:hypothetical protein
MRKGLIFYEISTKSGRISLTKEVLLWIADVAVCLDVLEGNVEIGTCATLSIAYFSGQCDGAVLIVDDLSSGEAAGIAFVAGV